ncbi:hypothetical protein TNCV_381151 [Trichonephila clavipes]|uniref:Uncharacterized protein n=1 Tax=Trichonephila clavipes TaxID=2585209 RepID=A0A8X6VKP9_TRICX|nr:hypothetical protein TNCV_381151 [Trichonephila clavipes]
MVYGGRPRPIHGHRSSQVASLHIVRNPQFFGEYKWKKKLTVEIIRIMILLRLNRERDEAPIADKALGPVGPCLKTSLHVSIVCSMKRLK